MILVGMFDSTFVRRVAVSMNLLAMTFEHRNWSVGNRMTQPDITAACVYTFLVDALAINRAAVAYPGLAAIAERCEVLPEFRSVKAEWFPPGDGG
jgi:glutathione S-transferase